MAQGELRGWDVEQLARRGAVSGALLRHVRDHETLAKRTKALVLFGPGKNLEIQPGDPPYIQVLFEQAKLYAEAEAAGEADLKQRVLATMSTALLGLANKHQNMFDSLLGLIKDMYKANLKATGGKDDVSDAELIRMAEKATDGSP